MKVWVKPKLTIAGSSACTRNSARHRDTTVASNSHDARLRSDHAAARLRFGFGW